MEEKPRTRKKFLELGVETHAMAYMETPHRKAPASLQVQTQILRAVRRQCQPLHHCADLLLDLCILEIDDK